MTSTSSVRVGVAQCAAAAVCFGAATPVSRRLLDGIDSFTLAGLLYLGAALVAVPASRRLPRGASRGAWARLALAVVVGGGVAPVLLLAGLERVPAPTVSILLNLELVATAVLATVAYHEHVTRRGVAGIGVLLVAGIVLAWEPGAGFDPAVLFVAGACACWGIDNATTAHLDAFSPAQITAAKGLVAGTVNVALGVATGHGDSTSVGFVIGALAVGTIGYGISIILWITGARRIGAARGQAIFATAPFVGVALAWPIAGEGLDARAGIAALIAAAGVVLVSTHARPHLHRHATITHAHPHRHDDAHHTHSHAPGVDVHEPHRHAHTHDAVTHLHDEPHDLGARHPTRRTTPEHAR